MCSVTASGKTLGDTGSTRQPQGEEGIAHGAVTMPASDKLSKKLHICPAQLPAAPCYRVPSWHTGSSLHHWNLLPLFSSTAVGETWLMLTLPAPGTRQSWLAGGGSTDPQLTAGSGAQEHTRALQDEDGVLLVLNPKGPFPTRQQEPQLLPQLLPCTKINIESPSQYL